MQGCGGEFLSTLNKIHVQTNSPLPPSILI